MATFETAWYHKAGNSLLDLLFPPNCLACDKGLDHLMDGISLCKECRQQLAVVDWPVCLRCAQRVPDLSGEMAGEVADCGHCRNDKLRFDRAMAWGQYEGLLGELIVKMKYDRSERLARMFCRLLLDDLSEKLGECGFDAVVAVPMHPWRRFRRGINPPAVMAKFIGRELQLPYKRSVLRRRNSVPQKGLTRSGRFRNMKNEMRTRAGYHLGAFRVLLIDDILTTGATCSEAARVLKQAGATQVTVLVVGRTTTS